MPARPSEVFTATVPYAVSGNVVADMPFCVEGGSMKIRHPSGNMFIMTQ